MRLRHATLGDLHLFRAIWMEHLEDQWKKGGEVVPNHPNMDFFCNLVTAYVSGARRGVVLFGADDNAVLLWGDAGSPLQSRWGDLAQGWGTYVRPEFRRQGVSKDMRELARAFLRRQGFNAVHGTGLNRNEEGIASGVKAGFELYANVGVLKLGE